MTGAARSVGHRRATAALAVAVVLAGFVFVLAGAPRPAAAQPVSPRVIAANTWDAVQA